MQRTSKLGRRATELLRLITLDVARIDFFDFPVVSEYEQYIMSYGKASRKQTATQTNDDSISRESQTEQIETKRKWTQNPPDSDDEFCGGDSTALTKLSKQEKNSAQNESLKQFTKDAGSAMLQLLNNQTFRQIGARIGKRDGGGRRKMETKFGATFGNKVATIKQEYLNLNNDSYQLERIWFPPNSSTTLLSLHGPKDGKIFFERPHYLVGWNTAAASYGDGDEESPAAFQKPQFIIHCGVGITSVAIESAIVPELVFTGHIDGSLSVYDLRSLGGDAAAFRSSGMLVACQQISTHDTHLAPLRCLLPLPLPSGSSLTESQAGLRCELLSLDDSGLLSTWAVADSGSSSYRTVSDDPSMLPGGRIRLLRSSYGNVNSLVSQAEGPVEPTCALANPTSLSRILVGISSGDVLHVSRYGGKGLTTANVFCKKYLSPVLNLANFGQVKSEENIGAFLAVTAIGISVYTTSRQHPVMNFDREEANFITAFPINNQLAQTVLQLSNLDDNLATIAAFCQDNKCRIFQIGPKFNNHWSGSATEIPIPMARSKSRDVQLTNVVFCKDNAAGGSGDDDADVGGDKRSVRYLLSMAFSNGDCEIYQSDLVQDLDQISSPVGGGESKTVTLIEYLECNV